MQLHTVLLSDLLIPKDRQRQEFNPVHLIELADSIASSGLLHPIVVREEEGRYVLVAGERRIRAMQHVWGAYGCNVRCGTEWFSPDHIPCLHQGELEPVAALEAEIEENTRRTNFTWQEQAAATAKLHALRTKLAKLTGEDPPTTLDIASELGRNEQDSTRKELILSRHLGDPDVAKAKSVDEGFKILKRKEELAKSTALGESVGKTFGSHVHSLIQGNCLEVMKGMPAESFDVILTDPPYGIDADKYGDSGGLTPGAHFYDDSFPTWSKLIRVFVADAFRVAKPQAHAYVFCDVDNFLHLRNYMDMAGWKCFRTPFIWVNPTAMRAPWPERGPQRKWQMCLYAVKGDRNVIRLYSDVLVCPSDENLGHPAQKPVALYQDLLRRSVRPGDTVLDPFCGSGPIFPAAHELKCAATGIEMDSAAYGISVKRIQELG